MTLTPYDVEVYFNLHKKLFSVRSRKTGRVIAHVDKVSLCDPKFVVRKSGRDRVRREGKKNVHAFVKGKLLDPTEDNLVGALEVLIKVIKKGKAVTYNPYKYESFVYADTEQPIDNADYAVLSIDAATNKTNMKAYTHDHVS